MISQGDWFVAFNFIAPIFNPAIEHRSLAGVLLDIINLNTTVGYAVTRIDSMHCDTTGDLYVLHTRSSNGLQYIARINASEALVSISPALPSLVGGVDYFWGSISGEHTGNSLVLFSARQNDSTLAFIDYALLLVNKTSWTFTQINGLDNNFTAATHNVNNSVSVDCGDNIVYYSEWGVSGSFVDDMTRIYVYNLTTGLNEALYYQRSATLTQGYIVPSVIITPGRGQLIVALPAFGSSVTNHGPVFCLALADANILWTDEDYPREETIGPTTFHHRYYRRFNAVTGAILEEVEQSNSPTTGGVPERPRCMASFFNACAARQGRIPQVTLIGAT